MYACAEVSGLHVVLWYVIVQSELRGNNWTSSSMYVLFVWHQSLDAVKKIQWERDGQLLLEGRRERIRERERERGLPSPDGLEETINR